MPLEHRSNDKVSSASLPTFTSSITLSKKWATWWLKFPILLLILIITNILSFIFGFTPIPQNVPIIGAIKQYIVVMITIAALLAVITAIALIIKYSSGTIFTGKNKSLRSKWAATLAIFLVILFIFETSMLGTVLIRPSWCPYALCFSPLLGTRGIYDTNLDAYFLTLQSPSYVIPSNPASYSQSNLPEQIGSQCIDCKAKSLPYRVVTGVHSLQQGQYGILIERVELKLVQMSPLDHPVSVWIPSSIDYSTNIYSAVYDRQNRGETIPAFYASPPYSYVELKPGEAEQLDIQLSSQIPVDLQFQIQISYRVTNQVQLHTLTIPNVFEVIFSDTSNWHKYQLQDGYFKAIQ